MTSLDATHEDVAAYALNLLEPEDAWRFELHLLTCDQCTTALAELTPVADVLAEVDAASMMAANRIFREGRILDGMLGTAAKQRTRTRALRLVTAAAAVVVVVIISVLTAAVGWGGMWPGLRPGGGTQAAGPDTATQAAPRPSGGTGQPAVAGKPTKPASEPNQTSGQGVCDGTAPALNFAATDPSTGVSAKVTASCETWGTPLIINLSNIVGPMSCQLVIRTKDGKEITTARWDLVAGGFGTKEQPRPAVFQGQSEVVLPQIAEIIVQKTNQGANQQLVAVSTNK